MALMPVFCIVHERLVREFADAVTVYSRLLSAEVAAALKGEEFPFEVEKAKVENRKEHSKQAILAHEEEHG